MGGFYRENHACTLRIVCGNLSDNHLYLHSEILIFGDMMMTNEITKIGKRGTVVIPAKLRKQMHLKEGDLVIAENHGDGILLKPAIALAVEKYTLERQAEFILSNAIDAKDYQNARDAVKAMGLNPDKIPHMKPKTRHVANG